MMAEAKDDLDALQAKLDAALRVVEAVRKVEFGAYPAHGYGFVTIVTGGVDEVQTALAAFEAAMKGDYAELDYGARL